MRLAGISALVLVLGLPLLGAWLAGRPLAALLQFPPPLEIPAGYLRFSWAAAAVVAIVLVATFLPWCRRRPDLSAPTAKDAKDAKDETRAPHARGLPRWGALALLWTVAWWTLAWTRWPTFEPWQRYTFFPLWLGFIITMNALIEARTGSCLMRRAPGRWLTLFAASAACWWAFEWLNRFARNWHYLNVEEFGPFSYALHATLSFSTVLPAIAAIAEWLDAHEGWRRCITHGPRWSWLVRSRVTLLLAGAGALALVGAGAAPDWFYAAVWIAPLAIMFAIPGPAGGRRLAGEIATGNWRRAATWMAAALICGFFWELWNWHSLAKWIYTVPGVERWFLFEMPALGYAGYLPFGLECLLVAEPVIGSAWQSRRSPAAH